jgi:hypothetical protein
VLALIVFTSLSIWGTVAILEELEERDWRPIERSGNTLTKHVIAYTIIALLIGWVVASIGLFFATMAMILLTILGFFFGAVDIVKNDGWRTTTTPGFITNCVVNYTLIIMMWVHVIYG